jgi:hypothetical protein
VGWGAVDSEELAVPCPGGVGGRSSEEIRFPVPVGWGAIGSEEPPVPCPGGTRRPRLRRAPVARSRRGGARGAPKSAVCPAPEGRGTHPGWGGRPSAPRSWRFPVPARLAFLARVERGGRGLRGGPVFLLRWGGVPSAPKSFRFPVPVRRGARGSEELRLLCPGEVGGRPSEEVRFPAPVRRGARRSEELRLLCPGEARLAAPRGVPSAWPRWAGCPAPTGGRLWPGSRRGRRASEEVRVPCPGGMGGRRLRGAGGSLSR